MQIILTAWVTGGLLIAVEIFRSVPALLQVRKHQSSDAVSPESIAILAGTGIGWVVLASILQAWPVLLATILWLVLHLLVCREVWKVSPDKRTRMLRTFLLSSAAFFSVTAVLFPLLGLTTALGLVLGVVTVLDSAPALIEGLRSATTKGLSILTLMVNTTEGLIYLAIGLNLVTITEKPGSVIGYSLYGVISIISSTPRLARVMSRRCRGLL